VSQSTPIVSLTPIQPDPNHFQMPILLLIDHQHNQILTQLQVNLLHQHRHHHNCLFQPDNNSQLVTKSSS
jgi:hypothetical protein